MFDGDVGMAADELDDFGGVLARPSYRDDDFVGRRVARVRIQTSSSASDGCRWYNQGDADIAVALVKFDIFVVRTLRIGDGMVKPSAP